MDKIYLNDENGVAIPVKAAAATRASPMLSERQLEKARKEKKKRECQNNNSTHIKQQKST